MEYSAIGTRSEVDNYPSAKKIGPLDDIAFRNLNQSNSGS